MEILCLKTTLQWRQCMYCACLVIPVANSRFTVYYTWGSCLVKSQTSEGGFWSLAVKSHVHVLQKGLRSVHRISIPKVLHQKSYRKGTVIFLWLKLDFFRMSLLHCLYAACSGAPGLGCLPILWGVRQQFLKSIFFHHWEADSKGSK